MMVLPHGFILLLYIYSTTGTEIKSSQDAADYLLQFGYIPHATENDVTSFRFPSVANRFKVKKMFTEAISAFQKYAGLQQSGQFDNATRRLMNMPRCGLAERMGIMENKNINVSIVGHKLPRRRKWKASRIHYRIGNLPASFEIDPFIAKHEIRRAFRLWEEVANLRCIEVDEKDKKHAEIDILFVSREHGDGNAFGQASLGNVVAHAFFPTHRHFEGDVHFDNERQWTAFNTTGINLFQVAAHEIGHALGLDHSRFPESVMHMIVQSEIRDDFQLHDDDIQGIQKLYGPRRRRQSYYSRGSDEFANTFNRIRVIKDRLPTLAHAMSFDMDFNQRTMTKQTNERVSDLESQTKIININAVVSAPMSDTSDFETSMQHFWKCFSIDREISQYEQRLANCYKQNVLRLLYSLKIL